MSEATLESAIASACRMLAKLRCPENVHAETLAGRIEELEDRAVADIVGGKPEADVLGGLRRLIVTEAAKHNERYESNVAMMARDRQRESDRRKRRR